MADERTTVKCPVCSTEIEVGSEVAKLYGAVRAAPRATSAYKEKTYYFCCKGCKKKFDESPEKFVKP
jgi:YHS domain-containing protein